MSNLRNSVGDVVTEGGIVVDGAGDDDDDAMMVAQLPPASPELFLLNLNQELLTSIALGDWDTYDRLCSDGISCMEPETHHQVVVGKAFHRYYFDVLWGSSGNNNINGGSSSNNNNNDTLTAVTMSQPHIQWLAGGGGRGENNNNSADHRVAVLSYVRLNQITRLGETSPVTTRTSETRVWEKQVDGSWKNVHFHRS
jgi:Calcium/calmodulin dependent protein kinase II association domain